MTDKEKNDAPDAEFRMRAFVIERFCGGKIEFSVEDISSKWDRIDIQRTYRDGKITYITRPAATVEQLDL